MEVGLFIFDDDCCNQVCGYPYTALIFHVVMHAIFCLICLSHRGYKNIKACSSFS